MFMRRLTTKGRDWFQRNHTPCDATNNALVREFEAPRLLVRDS
jgi:hypothetical protein